MPEQVECIVVERLDGGGVHDPGEYQCTAAGCGWRSLPGATRYAASSHVYSKHKGCRCQIRRLIPLGPVRRRQRVSEEEKQQNQQLRRQRYRVRALAAVEDPGEHVTFPVTISTGQIGRCCSSLTRGRGRRRIAGGWDEKGNEAAQVAVSVVALNAKRLRAWATGEAAGRGSWGLFNSLLDLSVCNAELDEAKLGYSSAACVALSLVCLLGGRMCAEPLVAVTGDIDLRGRVLEVGGIREKLEVLQRRGLRRLIIPEATHKELEASGEMEKEWPAELRDFGLEVMGTASNLVELMAVCMPGVRERGVSGAIMGAELDGPQVGVGFVTGLVQRDDVGMVEFQACSVGPGQMDLILTGAMSTVTKESVTLLVALISTTTRRIGQALGLPTEQAAKLRLVRPRHDLHVHCVNYAPIQPSYQQGAIYMALVAMMVRHRCRADTAVFGDVGTAGSFTSCWEFSAQAVEFCHFMGFRRVVLGKGTRLSEAARQAAAGRASDGGAKLHMVVVGTILEALPLMFDCYKQQQEEEEGEMQEQEIAVHEVATALVTLGRQ